jgi:hypothetical protein
VYVAYIPSKDSLIINSNANSLSIGLAGKLKDSIYSGVARIEKESDTPREPAFRLQVSNADVFSPMNYFYTEANAKMPAPLKNESTASFYNATVWPVNTNGIFSATIKSVINKNFNNKTGTKEPGALVLSEKNAFINGWKKETAKLSATEAKDLGLSLSQEVQKLVTVMYEDERIIALSAFNYSFTGGAHGNYITSITNIDKRTGIILSLKDVVTPQGLQLLPALLETAIREQYSLDKNKSLEENGMLVKKIVPSANFYIANGSLGFYYSPYEIMAYSYGEPNLFLPASVINSYLKAPYKKL